MVFFSFRILGYVFFLCFRSFLNVFFGRNFVLFFEIGYLCDLLWVVFVKMNTVVEVIGFFCLFVIFRVFSCGFVGGVGRGFLRLVVCWEDRVALLVSGGWVEFVFRMRFFRLVFRAFSIFLVFLGGFFVGWKYG